MKSSSSSGLGTAPAAEPFPYTEAASKSAAGWPRSSGGDDVQGEGADEFTRRLEAAREAGRQEGEARSGTAFEGHLQQAREGIREAVLGFQRERTEYFRKVENEVVQLALSLARKVLHREAQVDPLLLAGTVRVVLEKIENATKVIVRVHPQQAADFRAFFTRNAGPQGIPEIKEDPALERDRCILQTELGTTELGIEVQMKEIEQGLMDLLAQRPPSPK